MGSFKLRLFGLTLALSGLIACAPGPTVDPDGGSGSGGGSTSGGTTGGGTTTGGTTGGGTTGATTGGGATSCTIDGKSFPASGANPANPCQLCDPQSNAGGWSNAVCGSPCLATNSDAGGSGICTPAGLCCTVKCTSNYSCTQGVQGQCLTAQDCCGISSC